MKGRFEPDFLDQFRTRVSEYIAEKIATILGDPANKNDRLVNWIRIHTINTLILLVFTLLAMRFIQLNYFHQPLPYSEVVQAIGSILLAIGSIYLARNTFASKYFAELSEEETPGNENKGEELFEFVKGFSFLFWGASILLFGYVFPIWDRIYVEFAHNLGGTELQHLLFVTVVSVVISVGIVDTLIPMLSTGTAILGTFTFVVGIFVNWMTLFGGLFMLVLTLSVFLHIYSNMDFGKDVDEIDVEEIFNSDDEPIDDQDDESADDQMANSN